MAIAFQQEAAQVQRRYDSHDLFALGEQWVVHLVLQVV
jgi:hypothetical protein